MTSTIGDRIRRGRVRLTAGATAPAVLTFPISMSPTRSRLLALAVGLAVPALAVPALAAAQGAPAAPAHPHASPTAPGTRVRLEGATLGARPLVGTLTRLDAERVGVLLAGGDTIVLPVETVSRLQVARPRPSLQRNMTVGGTLGMLAGAGLYLSWCHADREGCRRDGAHDPSRASDDQPMSVGALAVIGGAVVGAGLAYALTPPRWETLALPVRVGLAPTSRGGLAIGATIGDRGR